MRCEQVEELLSAYLDDMLVSEERQSVATHLRTCSHCSSLLDDYRRLDAVLLQMPRVSPGPALRGRVFAALALQDADEFFEPLPLDDTLATPTVPHQRMQRNSSARPRLVALPGGRSTSTSTQRHSRSLLDTQPVAIPHRANVWMSRTMQILVAAALLLTFGIGGMITWQLSHSSANVATSPKTTITPPDNPSSASNPLPAGMHFVFLRDGTLWSGTTDVQPTIVRLTSSGVTVAPGWAIRPAFPGHAAGDMLAYIDTQQAQVHLLRSDGQSDFVLPLALLKAGVSPASVWDTAEGQTILNSLAWSPDGTRLAFVADPQGTGQPALYLYLLSSAQLEAVPLPTKGSIAHPVWSPDGVRLTFALTSADNTSVIDYNTQNRGILVIDNLDTSMHPTDTLLSLNWSPSTTMPAITWSAGTPGHVHMVGMRAISAAQAQILANGDYAQALYSSTSSGMGGWLLLNNQTMQLQRVDLAGNTRILASGKQVSSVQWSPDGSSISYLTQLVAGVGDLHLLSLANGADTLIASHVMGNPQPVWSVDSTLLAYSTDQHVYTFNAQTHAIQQLKIAGIADALLWSITSPTQLIVSVYEGGTAAINVQQQSVTQLATNSFNGTALWMQVP